MLNHSCTPNVFGSFNASTVTIRVVKPIKGKLVSFCPFVQLVSAGEQLFISYGPTYGTMLNPLRHDILQEQYHFE
jgi:hypothetical protein